MYRVELKECQKSLWKRSTRVPNVPCGVESYENLHGRTFFDEFLMYRVELEDWLLGLAWLA